MLIFVSPLQAGSLHSINTDLIEPCSPPDPCAPATLR